MLLKLTNNLSKITTEFSGLTDQDTSRLYYIFDITLPEGMDEGEYSYELFDDDNNSVVSGLAQIGDYVPENKTYTTQETNGYIQYNGN